MEASKAAQEFEELHEKRKKNLLPVEDNIELTDFDKLLKGIMQVPKEGEKENE